MEQKSPYIYWDKIKETRKGVLEQIRLVGEVILDQYEIQGASPDDYILKEDSFKIVTKIPRKPLEDIIFSLDDVEVLISKINSFSDLCIIEMVKDGIMEDCFGKDYFSNLFCVNLNSPFFLREIINYIGQSQKDIPNKEQYWITKNVDGDYFFDGNFVNIKNKKSQNVKIFNAVFSLRPKGGEIPYNEIIKQCHENGLKKITKPKILRALSGEEALLYRYVPEIKYYTTSGTGLFVAVHKSKNLIFNNVKK